MANGSAIQRSVSLRDQVSEAVLELLRNNDLGPGDRITEEALAHRFQVSRTPIREALARLAQRGVLERRRSGGYYVPLLSIDEVREIIAVRMLLEPAAVALATPQIDDRQVQQLNRAIKAQSDAVAKGDPAKFGSANESFHNVIFGAVPNKVLRKAIAQFDPHVHFMRAIGDMQADRYGKMLERQDEIREAIAKKDAEMAEHLWKNYLHYTREWLLEVVTKSHAASDMEAEPAAAD